MHVDSGTLRPVQWYFDNLLPEEMARTRLVDSLPKGEWDAWELLKHFGAESAGAITLLEPGQSLADSALVLLPDEELERRIQNMPRVSLGSTAPKKMSLAGAQEKLLVSCVDDVLYEPVGAQASTHILKPDALSDFYPNSAVNEWYCARIAQKMKLNVPEVQLRYVPSPVYIIQRFDRQVDHGKVTRLHTLDAAQALSISAGSKYTMSGAKSLRDVIQITRSKIKTRLSIFRWVVFNAFIGNGDAHLKNLSLFSNASGYELAPFYDLVSTATWNRSQWLDVELSFPIGDAVHFGALNLGHFKQLAEEIGLTPKLAEKEISAMVKYIEKAADEVLHEFEVKQVPTHLRAAQLSMIRSVRYMPIAEMVKMLR
jgi:serine/threonine-protein kinase HipA